MRPTKINTPDTKPGEEDVEVSAESHKRYAVATFVVGGRKIELRERIGLHVFEMPEEARGFHFELVAKKLRQRVSRYMQAHKPIEGEKNV